MTLSTDRHPARRPGLVHFALAVGGFAIGTAEFAPMSLLPEFAAGLGIDEPTAGHVISAYALGVVVGAPLLAVLGARMSRRVLLLVLMGLFALGNLLSAVAPSYEWMLFFRFLAGLPHGAYFGIAALVAASLVPADKRTEASARVLLGLSVATIAGVPLANWLGHAVGWRWAFALAAILAMITVAMVAALAPRDAADPEASPLRELNALRRRQVWLTLGVGAIGFGGMFAVYAYLASTMLAVTGVGAVAIQIALAVFGAGMVAGNILVPRLADRALMPTAAALLVWSAVMLAFYAFAAGHLWLLLIDIFLIGIGGALGPVLQVRLMDVAGDAQALAAALNHSAFNFANALGPLLAGSAIAAGLGFESTGLVGAGLALGGLAVLGVAAATSRRAVVPVPACA
jgi:DHA1 family inner membrane transport protein